jgi:hypothetical protein
MVSGAPSVPFSSAMLRQSSLLGLPPPTMLNASRARISSHRGTQSPRFRPILAIHFVFEFKTLLDYIAQ